MEIWNYTALELGAALREGACTVPETVEALRQRERETAACGAYLAVDWERALEEAEALQRRICRRELTAPLAGVPVLIKDNICTRGIPTTCASAMLKSFVPAYDAAAVERLKRGGMLVLGKANMDEFAMGSTSETSCFGPVKNPWDLTRTPGGSSGGSAAAVAAGSAFCALGSDTGGSIRQPASHCGITGVKPTYGRVSRYGLIAYASSLDQIGPMARDARDCAAVLELICGRDPRDMTSRDGAPVRPAEIGVRGMKIGIPAAYLDMAAEEVKACVQAAAAVFEARGAMTEVMALDSAGEAVAAYYIIACAEAASNLSRYDGWKYGFRTPESGRLREQLARTRTQGFGPEVRQRILLGNFVLSAGYREDYYRRAQWARDRVKAAFARAFARYDLLLAPAAPETAPGLGELAEDPVRMYQSDCHTVGVNLAGLPAMTLPGGWDKAGMPVGIQLIAPAMAEARLFQAGMEFQRVTAYHRQWPEVKAP